jgi:hypothetical protein
MSFDNPRGSQNPVGGRTPVSLSKDIFKAELEVLAERGTCENAETTNQKKEFLIAKSKPKQ